MSEEFKTVLRVCIGDRIEKGKRVQAWLTLDDGLTASAGDRFNYFNKPISGAGPGGVWKFTLTETGSYFINGEHAPVYVYRYIEPARVDGWQVEHRLTATILKSRAAAKRLQTENPFSVLEPLRERYQFADKEERRALLILIIEAVQGTMPLK